MNNLESEKTFFKANYLRFKRHLALVIVILQLLKQPQILISYACNFDSQGQVLCREIPWDFFSSNTRGSKLLGRLSLSPKLLAPVSARLLIQSLQVLAMETCWKVPHPAWSVLLSAQLSELSCGCAITNCLEAQQSFYKHKTGFHNSRC